VRDFIARAARLATSAITYVEVRSALARRWRARDLSLADYRDAVRQFENAWGRYVRIDVTDGVLAQAARLAEAHGLRAYDAIHLGSAILLRARIEAEVTLGSWDDELDAAALKEGLYVLRPRQA
jgi:predicted nucleic acid-binding protein